MTLLVANRLLRETRMQPVVEAVYTVLRYYVGRMDGLLEEQSQVAADAARQEVAIRALRRRMELLEGMQREERKKE